MKEGNRKGINDSDRIQMISIFSPCVSQERVDSRKEIQGMMEKGISAEIANEIWNKHKDQSLHLLQQNPYEIVGKISGWTFAIADRVALQHFGFSRNSFER